MKNKYLRNLKIIGQDLIDQAKVKILEVEEGSEEWEVLEWVIDRGQKLLDNLEEENAQETFEDFGSMAAEADLFLMQKWHWEKG